MKTVAIIPARGGSKRIPRKNIKPFCGKPMISWSIKAAQDSKVFDAIIVSTDDEEIAQVARDCGAEAPFKRPPELSGDHALTLPVIAHAIHWFEENRVVSTPPLHFWNPTIYAQGLKCCKNAKMRNLPLVSPLTHSPSSERYN
jgi:N-acylneuraminate cytidylyltransferase